MSLETSCSHAIVPKPHNQSTRSNPTAICPQRLHISPLRCSYIVHPASFSYMSTCVLPKILTPGAMTTNKSSHSFPLNYHDINYINVTTHGYPQAQRRAFNDNRNFITMLLYCYRFAALEFPCVDGTTLNHHQSFATHRHSVWSLSPLATPSKQYGNVKSRYLHPSQRHS